MRTAHVFSLSLPFLGIRTHKERETRSVCVRNFITRSTVAGAHVLCSLQSNQNIKYKKSVKLNFGQFLIILFLLNFLSSLKFSFPVPLICFRVASFLLSFHGFRVKRKSMTSSLSTAAVSDSRSRRLLQNQSAQWTRFTTTMGMYPTRNSPSLIRINANSNKSGSKEDIDSKQSCIEPRNDRTYWKVEALTTFLWAFFKSKQRLEVYQFLANTIIIYKNGCA